MIYPQALVNAIRFGDSKTIAKIKHAYFQQSNHNIVTWANLYAQCQGLALDLGLFEFSSFDAKVLKKCPDKELSGAIEPTHNQD